MFCKQGGERKEWGQKCLKCGYCEDKTNALPVQLREIVELLCDQSDKKQQETEVVPLIQTEEKKTDIPEKQNEENVQDEEEILKKSIMISGIIIIAAVILGLGAGYYMGKLAGDNQKLKMQYEEYGKNISELETENQSLKETVESISMDLQQLQKQYESMQTEDIAAAEELESQGEESASANDISDENTVDKTEMENYDEKIAQAGDAVEFGETDDIGNDYEESTEGYGSIRGE